MPWLHKLAPKLLLLRGSCLVDSGATFPTRRKQGADKRFEVRDKIEQAMLRVTAIIGSALDDSPDQEPYQRFYRLAETLRRSFEESRSMETLEEAIRLYRRSLSLCPESGAGFDDVLFGLAYVLDERYQHEGSIDDIQECIELLQQCLELRPNGHSSRDVTIVSLGNAFGVRYARHGDEEDLKRRIVLYEESLDLHPPGHFTRDSSLNSLGSAIGDRYARHGDEEDLKWCIVLYEESLELRPLGHSSRSTSLITLGNALGDRYAQHGDEEDLKRRIVLYEESVELCPPGHPTRECSLNNLGNALGDRYARHGDEEDRKRRIELYEECLELSPHRHPTRDMYLNNLGNALGDRYALHGDEEDLKRSIVLYEESLELRPRGHPMRDSSLNNLGSALRDRYARYGDKEDLKRRIVLYKESFELRPPGHPTRDMSLCNLAEAMTEIRDALGDGPYAAQGNVDPFALLEDEVRSGNSTESGMLKCALKWVVLAERYSHESLGEAFRTAVGCLRRYLSIGPTAERQYKAMLRQMRLATLPTDAAAYFIKRGDIGEAIVLLDEGRSLLWAEMRRFREPLTSEERMAIGEELSSRYTALCQEIFTLSNSEVSYEASTLGKSPEAAKSGSSDVYGKLLNEKRSKLKEHGALVDQIRQIRGCEDFQRPAKFEKLKAAAIEGPVVIINCSKRRSDVIVVFPQREPLLIPLKDDFFQLLEHTSHVYLEKLSRLSVAGDISATMSRNLERVSKQLWKHVVSTVVDALFSNGIPQGSRIWWCPTSFLTPLPIHAAGSDSESLVDHFISSYTPTLSALISTRQAARGYSSPPRMLVVAQTKTSKLKESELELETLRKLACFQRCLDEEDATPKKVANHLPSYDWAHFICHGTVADNPFESCLHLYDKSELSLSRIIALHIPNAKFAFLAACHSAAQSRGTSLKDELLHLAAAMQVSGFQSVVGTLWQMKDGDGPRVAQKFYEEIFSGECAAEGRHTMAAQALWKAVRWLKDECENDPSAGKSGKKGVGLARWANYIHIGV